MRLTLAIDSLLLLSAVLIVSAVVVSAAVTRFAKGLRVPGALLFLGLGMLAGDDLLNLISLEDPELVQNVGVVALLVILLEGGLTTKPTDMRLAALPGLLLATVGVVITAAVTATGVWLLLDVDLLTAGLIGAVVASTDAAAVFAMMRTTPLPRRVSALLRVESGSNDPIAVLLTVGLLTTHEQGATVVEWVSFAAVQLIGGVVVGLGIGFLAVATLRRFHLGVEGLYPIAVGAVGVLAYGVAASVAASGFVAVYVTGVVVGSKLPRRRRSIVGFHEALANLAEIGLFLLLGLLVFPSQLLAVAVPALLTSAVLMLVARPIAVWACTLGQHYAWRERVVLVVGGLKGAVPIVLATFPLTAGMSHAPLIFDIVFFVVLVSLLSQGLALLPTVRRLGFLDTEPAWAPIAQALPLEGIEVDLIEVHISPGLPLIGKQLSEAPLPTGSIVTAVIRRDAVVVPRGSTRLYVDDILLITSESGETAVDRVTAWARGEDPRP